MILSVKPNMECFRRCASSQVRNPSKKSFQEKLPHARRCQSHETGCTTRWLVPAHCAHCTPHSNSSEGAREAGLPSEHLRSVGNIALIACARGLPGRKSRQTKAAEAWMLHANPMSMRVHLQSTDRAASACHGARQTL
jgi:hypothetical protein